MDSKNSKCVFFCGPTCCCHCHIVPREIVCVHNAYCNCIHSIRQARAEKIISYQWNNIATANSQQIKLTRRSATNYRNLKRMSSREEKEPANELERKPPKFDSPLVGNCASVQHTVTKTQQTSETYFCNKTVRHILTCTHSCTQIFSRNIIAHSIRRIFFNIMNFVQSISFLFFSFCANESMLEFQILGNYISKFHSRYLKARKFSLSL